MLWEKEGRVPDGNIGAIEDRTVHEKKLRKHCNLMVRQKLDLNSSFAGYTGKRKGDRISLEGEEEEY